MPDWEAIGVEVSRRGGLRLQIVATPPGRAADIVYSTVDPPVERGVCFCVETSMRRVRIYAVLGAFAAPLLQSIVASLEKDRSDFDQLCAHFVATGLNLALGSTVRVGSSQPDERETSELFWIELPYSETGFDHPSGIERLVQTLSAAIDLLLTVVPYSAQIQHESKMEGARHQGNLSLIERSRVNRRVCLEIHGHTCGACGVLLEAVYGSIGHEVIEVHHIEPVSSFDAPKIVNPRTDLVPLCPNCHTIVHRSQPPLPVAELKELLRLAKPTM